MKDNFNYVAVILIGIAIILNFFSNEIQMAIFYELLIALVLLNSICNKMK
jgi:hypothetical protein